jgi:hypothetical protein
LQYIADFGHELLLIQLWGQEDREPTGTGELELIDAETGTHLRIALDERSCQAYTNAFDDHADEVRKVALRNGGRYSGVSTNMPIDEAIFGPLKIMKGV